jgi:hypothetical protein
MGDRKMAAGSGFASSIIQRRPAEGREGTPSRQRVVIEVEMELILQITVESKVEVGSLIVVMKDLTDMWTGQKISEQRRLEKRLDIWNVMRNVLKEQQDVVVVMVVVNEWKEFIVSRMKLLRGNELLLMVQRNWDLES